MADIRFEDVTKIFPFQEVTGLFNRRQQRLILEQQKTMPYTSNEGVIALQHLDLHIKTNRIGKEHTVETDIRTGETFSGNGLF